MTDDAPEKADERDQEVRPERHTPEYDRTVSEPPVEVCEEPRGSSPRRRILCVRIGSQYPVSDQPDRQRDEDEPGGNGNAEENQLTAHDRNGFTLGGRGV